MSGFDRWGGKTQKERETLQVNTYSLSEAQLRRWVYLLKGRGAVWNDVAKREVIEELENILEGVPR